MSLELAVVVIKSDSSLKHCRHTKEVQIMMIAEHLHHVRHF